MKGLNMFVDTALDVGTNAIIAAYPYLSIHTTGAVTSSANESAAARVAANWSASSGGDTAVTSKNFTGGAASGPAIRVGYWSLATGGVYGGGSLLTGDQTFNAAGEYTVTGIAEGSSSI
jgi:hypothetical protein